jgi:cell shape-determining protein MreC
MTLAEQLSERAAKEAVYNASKGQIAYLTSQTTHLQQEIERLRKTKDEYKQQASDRQTLAASKTELEGRIVLLKDDLKKTETKMEDAIGQIYSEALVMYV